VRNYLVLPVVLTGVLLTQQACAGQAVPAGSTSGLGAATPVTAPAARAAESSAAQAQPAGRAAKAPAQSATRAAKGPGAAAGGVLSGTRQVFILPKNNEATVAVDASMRAGLSDDFGNRALFVFTPEGDRYSIKTAKLRVGNKPTNETYCLAVKSRKVVATSCDSADDNQLFYVLKSGTNSGKPTYVIRTKDYVFLRVATPTSNLSATKIEEGTADAGADFLLPDRGKATLPALD